MPEANSIPPPPNLAQQLKEQAQMIQELTALIQEKELELAGLSGQKQLVEELSHKLQETEDSNYLTYQQLQSQAMLIEELSIKLQEAEIRLTAAFIQNRHTIAENVVKTHIVAGMALGLIPLPMLDMAASSGVQANLLRNLCQHYAVDFDEQASKHVLSAMIRGSIPVLTVLSISSFTKLIPGIGTIGGGISMTLAVGASIYATGQVFIRHFEAGGNLQNFNNDHWRAFFKQQFEEGKAYIKENRIRD